jgi:UDP-N-acetylmuramyl pentapeptide synthase
MGVKLIITERQLNVIKEDNFHTALVEKLVSDLNANYEPMLGVMREEGEYHEQPMIKVKIDDRSITPKELFEYFKKKYRLGNDFIQQVIKDWAFGTLKGNKLSKNVTIN